MAVNDRYTNPTGIPGGEEEMPLTGRDLRMRQDWDRRNPPPAGWQNPYDVAVPGTQRHPADLGANYGGGERKGAAYTVKATRSHDYSGTEQSPHHTRTVRPISQRRAVLGALKHEEIGAEVARGEHDWD